jgi:uncharacterized C2H2 Zn-finger protein
MLKCTRCAETFVKLGEMRPHMLAAHSVTVTSSGARIVPKWKRSKSRSRSPQHSIGADNTGASSSLGRTAAANQRKQSPSNLSHQCNVCLACFPKGNKLRNHMRTHTGERPFQCDICKMRFTNNSSLTRYYIGTAGFD